ncbi:LicD family protein [Lachnospiraceae bacterium JLR.KK008]
MNNPNHNTTTYIDQIIHDSIMASSDHDYSAILASDSREEIHCQLSEAYSHSLVWYPFAPEAHVLVLEDGFGPFLGDLCNRVKEVTVLAPSSLRVEAISHRYKKYRNLQVESGSLKNLTNTQIYDYVIVMDGSSLDEQNIVQLLSCVRDSGRLLLGVDNRFGLQNWCGKADVVSGIPLNGIASGCKVQENGEADKNTVEGTKKENEREILKRNDSCGLDKKGLQQLFAGCGLSEHNYKFYYPMPDHRCVKGIYTDERQPKNEEIAYLGSSYIRQKSALMVDTDILPDIVENGVFLFFANSYMVEISKDGSFAQVNCGLLPWTTNEKNAGGKAGKFDETEGEDRGGEQRYTEQDSAKAREQTARNRELLAVKGNAQIWEPDSDAERIREVKKVQIDLLGRLKLVCDRHHLQLYLIYGTLLGAVRHGGMIPGDDDIDVALPREDYNKLMKLTDEFPDPYFLQTPWNDQCFYGGYSRLRNKETTSIHPHNWFADCCEGIGIDIFPLDYGYANPLSQWLKQKRLCFYQRMLYAKAYGFFARFLDMPLLIWKFYKYLGLPFSRQKLADRLDRIAAGGDGKHRFGIYTHYSRGKSYRRLSARAFEEKVVMQYENILLDAPAGYDKLLSKQYGNNYMTMPCHEEGKQRHGFYDVQVPYGQYKVRFLGGSTLDLGDRELVLFGDSTLFSYFFERYPKYRPAHIVTTGTWKSPDEINGITVEDLAEFMHAYPVTENRDKFYCVICTIYVREAERILKDAGLDEYHIFAYNRYWLLLADTSYALKEIEEDGEENDR